MPYPVPPPLPPVVHVVLPEESHSVVRSASVPEPFAAALPLDAAACAQPSRCEAADHTAESPPSSIDSPVNSLDSAPTDRAGEAVVETAALTAEPLGAPLSVNAATDSASRQLPFSESTTAPLPALPVVVPLPELDRLTGASVANPAHRRARSQRPWFFVQSRASTASLLPTASERTASTTPEGASPAQTPSANPPLYTPELGEDAPPDAEEVRPDTDEATPPPEIDTDALPPVPTPEPAPSDGQILTIPTPNRPREESEEAAPPGAPPATPPANGTVPVDPMAVGEVLEVTADRQEYNEREQIFYAEGNVVMRFRRGTLAADRLRVNIPNRVAVAEGNAVLTRGEQTLFGQRFEYNFGLNQGNIIGARGEIFVPAAEQDFDAETFDTTVGTRLNRPVTQQVSGEQNLQVFPGTGGINFGVATPNQNAASTQGGDITQFRFEAETAEFDGERLIARNVRVTNDPFSPPELEFRANELTYTRLNQFQAEIRARNPRIVFDQGLTLPLPINRQILDNRERQAGLVSFGFDQRDRDGFYIERPTPIYSGPNLQFTVTPQILVQRAFDSGSVFDPSNLGLVAQLDAFFGPNTSAEVNTSFSSLDFDEIGDNLRASVRARHRVFNHTVALEYSYRDRLFNGSLGFQDVQSSLGLVVTSPRYTLGNTGINLTYQGSVQYVNAATDQSELFPADRAERNLNCIDPDDREFTGLGCADLLRYQATATLSRFFLLWAGTALPPTPDQGLRYSPFPIVPYVGVNLEARGVYSGYSNGDSQSTLRGGISLLGQFGRLARQTFDYTAFNVTYYQTLQDGDSPFLFDRNVDEEVLEGGITQQIYGPLLLGVRTSFNLDTGDNIDTIISLEYRRRTYSLALSYSTEREAAALSLRINDFNWLGDPGPFSGLGAPAVEGGAIQAPSEPGESSQPAPSAP